MMLEIVQPDGERQLITTDADWKSATAPIRRSELYDGEHRDATFDQPGWTRSDFDARSWDTVWPAPDPTGRILARPVQPIRETRTLSARSIVQIAPRRHIVDFGQNFAGRVRLRLRGRSGNTVTVLHAELLDGDGRLDRRNLRAAQAQANYQLAGEGVETLEPRFTYHGFRYAEVTGPETLTARMVEGVVLGSALPETGEFRIDQPVVQALWHNTLWSQRSNFIGVPTDCPQRDERLAWTGDAQVFWDTAAHNMDVGAFTRAFMGDLRDSQAANGGFPLWAPTAEGLGWGTPTPTPGWADAGVMLPHVSYLHSGDRTIVDENWSAMTAYVGGVLADNPDHLWSNGRGADLGDWLSLDATNPFEETTPKTLVATAMLARSAGQLAEMAAWTGRTDEAARWSEAHAAIRQAFASEFVDANGKVGNGSHTSHVLALRLGLTPASLAQATADLLAADIRRRGGLLSTGFLGTPLALDALADHGHGAVAWDLLLRTAYPSWGYMVAKGATTIWERWNGDTGDVAMNSYNHYALGAVCAFLYRRVAGVEPLAPGYGHVRIRPLADPRVGRAGATYRSVRGPISTDWHYQADGSLRLDIDIPANTRALIELPGATVRLGGARTGSDPDGSRAGGPIQVGPGRHSFLTRALTG
jgi:alpha-L-rhamnosidase